ncbi:hypothetical protein [Parafrigoribacterium soli]|uniref:hypothetical protein n=1 Tax=Parafrigoribacterium soli TaxID=3144663 RepID=UPI0032EFC75E
MKRFALLTTIVTAVLTLVLPFVGGSGPALGNTVAAYAGDATLPAFASPASAESAMASIASYTNGAPASIAQNDAAIRAAASAPVVTTVDTEHLAQKPVPKPVIVVPPAPNGKSGGGTAAQRRAAYAASGGGCPANVGGAVNGNADLASFAAAYNAIRVANCLQPVPMSHFRYDTCMQTRLQWMANDPSADPGNTWGHAGVHSINPDPSTGLYYSDTTPSVGCDGNLAGGSGNTGATVAQKWWDSLAHRASLYRPTFTGTTANVCIAFAMTHGGNGDSAGFTRAAARWIGC